MMMMASRINLQLHLCVTGALVAALEYNFIAKIRKTAVAPLAAQQRITCIRIDDLIQFKHYELASERFPFHIFFRFSEKKNMKWSNPIHKRWTLLNQQNGPKKKNRNEQREKKMINS